MIVFTKEVYCLNAFSFLVDKIQRDWDTTKLITYRGVVCPVVITLTPDNGGITENMIDFVGTEFTTII